MVLKTQTQTTATATTKGELKPNNEVSSTYGTIEGSVCTDSSMDEVSSIPNNHTTFS